MEFKVGSLYRVTQSWLDIPPNSRYMTNGRKVQRGDVFECQVVDVDGDAYTQDFHMDDWDTDRPCFGTAVATLTDLVLGRVVLIEKDTPSGAIKCENGTLKEDRKPLSVADLLLSIDYEFNGHKQTSIPGLTLEQCESIVEDLNTKGQGIFYLRNYGNDEFSIYQEDYWEPGEHPIGHVDRLILSIHE